MRFEKLTNSAAVNVGTSLFDELPHFEMTCYILHMIVRDSQPNGVTDEQRP